MDSAAAQLEPLLSQLVNYERLRPDARLWDLTTMRALLAHAVGGRGAAGPVSGRAVQVGGSKGKGTTCAFLEALARGAGRSTGVYSSPHLVTLLERVRLDGHDVTVAALEPELRAVLATPGLERPPTFFEAMTAAAERVFARNGVDLAIYEVGLGGRHDATTAVPVEASVVTMIELEHTDVLGETEVAIAGEKAPVIRPGGVGFTGATGNALATIRAHAAAVDARLLVLGEDFAFSEPEFDGIDARFAVRLPGGVERSVVLPAASAFELPALTLALAVLHELMPAAEPPLTPAPRPVLPGRFEVVEEPDGEVLVLDGAHTERSVEAVVAECRRRWPGRRPAVLCSAAAGKRWRESLSGLVDFADSCLVTGLVGTPGEDPEVIANFFATRGLASETVADMESGLRALRQRPGPRLVIGSFYLVGQVRELVSANDRSR